MSTISETVVVFDGGGGAVLRSRNYQHNYSGYSGAIHQLADDVLAILEGESPDSWEGNEVDEDTTHKRWIQPFLRDNATKDSEWCWLGEDDFLSRFRSHLSEEELVCGRSEEEFFKRLEELISLERLTGLTEDNSSIPF